MTGENEQEHERDSAGDVTPPDDSLPELSAESGESAAPEPVDDAPRPRRFGAWGAARREEPSPSLFHRASQKIKGLFSRKKDAAPEATDDPLIGTDESFSETESSSDDLPYLVAPDEHADVDATPETTWPADDVAAEPASLSVSDAPSIPIVEPPSEEHKEDLKFLWNADESAVEEPALEAHPVEETTGDMDAIEVPAEAEAPLESIEAIAEPPRAKRPSLFKRLFGFGKKEQPSEEIPDTGENAIPAAEAWDDSDVVVEEPAVAETADELPGIDEFEPAAPAVTDVPAFAATQAIDVDAFPEAELEAAPPVDVTASIDEALPMDEPVHAEASEEFVGDGEARSLLDEPEPPKKPGFFARLFGRKSTEAPPPVEMEPETDPEHDAAEQLDAVDEGFEVARSEFAPPEHVGDQSFATVDDALPLDSTPVPEPQAEQPQLYASTMDMQPAVTASSFAPPAHEPPVVEAAATPSAPSSDEHMFFGGNTFDFESPKSDDRSTMEVTPVSDDRKTAEVSAADAAAVAAHADEVERKTDEFEMIELDGATMQEPAVSPLAGKTAEVPKVGFIKKLFGRTKEVTQVEPAVAPPPSANPTFLVQKFRTFYNEVVVYKNQKTEFTAGFATAIVTDYTADLSPEQAAQSLSVRLQQMLELQLAESSWMGGEIQELYPDAQYAMACLADEMLTHLEWPGREAWGRHRLELTIFRTVASDLEVFKRMDKLLKNGPRTAGTRDLARVYLLVVASGFKGKYRPFDLPRALAEYRRRLYEFVYNGDALLLYDGERRIFPEAVSVTVSGRGVKRFSMAQQWAAILVLLLVGYTVVSQMAWKKVSADLKDIAARVEQARTSSSADSPNGGGGR